MPKEKSQKPISTRQTSRVKASKAKPVADQAEAKPRGRPSKYSPALIDEICERISLGEPLREICRSEHMPNWSTVYDWLDADADFSRRFARARDKGEEAIAQECLAIADNATNDWLEAHGQDAVAYKINGEHVQRSKLRIETRLKLLAKWNPKKWGEKVDVNHGGQEGNPITTTTKVVIVPPKAKADVTVKPLDKDGD